MDLYLSNPLLSPFVITLVAHFYLIRSCTSSFNPLTDDSSNLLTRQSLWAFIGTRSKVPCVPLTIRNCTEINIKGKKKNNSG